MSLIVDVDPEVFDAASVIFGQQMTLGLDRASSQLVSVLSGCGSMAGSDEAGMSWAQQYDPSAGGAVGVITDLSNACSRIAELLQQTGFNHGMAESSSDPTRSVPTPADRNSYDIAVDAPSAPPAAAGGSSSPPHGWGLVEHIFGLFWPNGDTGKLRDAAAAWSTASSEIGAVSYYVPEAVEAVSAQTSPEVDDATTVCNSMSTHLTDTASACQSLSSACSQLAGHIDTAHSAIEGEITSLIEWTAGTEIVGGVISFFTAGIAEVPTQAVEAGRIATAGARIVDICNTLIRAANTVTETVMNVLDRVAEVASKLKIILGAKITEAAAALAARLPGLGRTAETLAESGLEDAAETSTANDALFAKYLQRKAAEGKAPLSRAAWQKRIDTLANNKVVGDAYRDQVAEDLGITPGKDGWQTEYTLPNSGRRFDIANPKTQAAIEVKSGTTPTAEGLTQLSKDEAAVRQGWSVTWQLKTNLSPTLMARLQELAAKYPGSFTYTIAGK